MIVSGRRRLNGNPTCQRGSYRTRPIAHPRGQPSGSSSLTLRVTKASLTVRVTIAAVTACLIILTKPLSALCEL